MNLSKDPKILIIIPAYNEENSIQDVVRELLAVPANLTVLVVNDGSADHTAEQADLAGAEVISLAYNLGIGGAVQTGYIYAERHHYDIAVQVDADGQHKPRELSRLLQPIFCGTADMVLGSRFVTRTQYRSSFSRRLGIIVLSGLVSIMNRQRIYDVTSGFRAVNHKGIALFARDYSTDFPEVDSLVLFKHHGLRIQEISVEMEPRLTGRSSITKLKSLYYMLKVSLTLLMRMIRKERIKTS